jgi:hypothetical protein
VIQSNFENIKAYIRELGDRGVLDDTQNNNYEPPHLRVIEAPAKWQREQSAWQDSSSHYLINVLKEGPSPSSRFMQELQRVSKIHGFQLEFSSPELATGRDKEEPG